MDSTKSFKWIPTDHFIHAILVKSFLPLKKLPDLVSYSNNYFNLYPGNELYIFEQTEDRKWSRAYLCWNPLPEKYIVLALNYGSKLPDVTSQVVIFPTKFAALNPLNLPENTPHLRLNLESADKKHPLITNCSSPPLSEVLHDMEFPSNSLSSTILQKQEHCVRPIFPYFRYEDRKTLDEVGPILALLASYIYVIYSANEPILYDKLTKLNSDFERYHIRLTSNLSTKHERVTIIRSCSALHSKLCRYISMGTKKEIRKRQIYDKKQSNSNIDPSAFSGIFARDADTGILLNLDNTDIKTFIRSNVLHGLLNDFPLNNFEALSETNIIKKKQFDDFTPVGMLIDVLDVNSSPDVIDPKFNNLSAYMYLRTRTEILTDCFTVNIRSDNILSLDNISAALFSNINESKSQTSNIFLVVVLFERIPIKIRKTDISNYKYPDTTILSDYKFLNSMKRGISVGVADITRVFSDKQGALTSGVTYKFKVNLFGSYFEPSTSASATKIYSSTGGWGELVENILNNSAKGVVINPRAISLWISVKEFRGKLGMNKIIDSGLFAIKNIPRYGFDRSLNSDERIQMTLGKVTVENHVQNSNIKFLSVRLISNYEKLLFSSSSTDKLTSDWSFISTSPGEKSNETVRISGIEHLPSDAYLSVYIYFNGFLSATGSIAIKKDNVLCVSEMQSSISLMTFDKQTTVRMEISKLYFGERFCIPSVINSFLSFNYDFTIKNHEKVSELFKLMMDLNNEDVNDLLKFHDKLLNKCVFLFYEVYTSNFEKELKMETSIKILGYCLQFLHTIKINSNKSRSIFMKFVKNYSNISSQTHSFELVKYLLTTAQDLLNSKSIEYKFFRYYCLEFYVYIIVFSAANIPTKGDDISWKAPIKLYFDNCINVSAGPDDFTIKEQCTIIKDIDIIIDTLFSHFSSKELFEMVISLLNSFKSTKVYQNYICGTFDNHDYEYMYQMLLIILRIIKNEKFRTLFQGPDISLESTAFLSKVIERVIQIYQTPVDTQSCIPVMRLCNSIFLEIISTYNILPAKRNMLRLIPTFCKIFCALEKYCQDNFYYSPKRLFTNLFPDDFPPLKLTVGSSVGSIVLVEIIMELSTIISKLVFISYELYGENLSMGKIIRECRNHPSFEYFQGPCYSSIITTEDMVLIVNLIKKFLKGNFYPCSSLLAITAMLLKASNILLYLFKDFLIVTIKLNDKNTSIGFNIKLWVEYLKLTMKISNNRLTYISTLAIIPRIAVHKIFGETKELTKIIFWECWKSLSPHTNVDETVKQYGVEPLSTKQQRILFENNSFLRQIISITLHQDGGLCNFGLKIIWQMVCHAWKLNGDLTDIKKLLISSCYDLSRLNPIIFDNLDLGLIIDLNINIVHIPVEQHEFLNATLSFYRDFNNFLSLIINTQMIPDIKEYATDRTMQHLEILTYLLDTRRPMHFYKLVSELFSQFIERHDYVQAAVCLEQVALTYNWDPSHHLEALEFFDLPEQSAFDRREYLYIKSAKYFVKGSKHEKALTLYKDLTSVYENIYYNLSGLSYAHLQISKIYHNLQTIDRFIPTYFCVTFLGYGFSISKRNRSFIYEGKPFEHISSMHAKLLRYHHGSTIVTTQERANELSTMPTVGKFIYVTTVEPQLNISSEHYNFTPKYDISSKIRSYVENRNLKSFVSLRRLPGFTSVVDLWVQEYKYVTAATFPTLMDNSEVIKIESKKLSPIENAIRMLQLKIHELYSFESISIKAIKEHKPTNEIYSEMSRCVIGTITAPINGGIVLYKEFFEPSHKEKVSSDELKVLVKLFDELAVVLGRSLILLNNMLPSKEFLNTQQMLVKQYRMLFTTEIQRNNIVLDDKSISSSNDQITVLSMI